MRKSTILDPRGPKVDQNGAQERSKNELGGKSVLGPPKSERPGYFFACFLLIMLIFGHFWGPLKNQGGAKNGPKNSIRRFLGAQKRPKGAKKSFLGGSEKVFDI